MAISTYDELVADISEYLDRDDLAAKVDTFIRLAESRHERDIRIRQMLQRGTATVADRFLALPSDFLEMRTLRLLTDPVTVLAEINFHEMNRVRRETTSTPAFYTVHDDIEFDVVPDSVITAEMIYYSTFDPLSTTNASNDLLARAPDAYLYASLLEAALFTWDDEQVEKWAQLYRAVVDRLNGMDKRRAGPLVSKVVGATP